MLNIAKLGADTVRTYYKSEYAAETNRYYQQEGTLPGVWSGKLAAELGLDGAVTEEQFNRLAEGMHPFSGEQLIAHRTGKAVDEGREMAHVAAYDIVLRPAKGVSLAGLVGGDERVREVVRAANAEAMSVLEGYVQQRMGGHRLPQTTGKWIVATFEHDTARPVDGYPAPLIHHHNVVMAMTCEDPNAPEGDRRGQARALWTQEIYKAQSLAEAVYQSEIAHGLRALGYQTRKGADYSTEIAGFSKAYLDAESPRSKSIQAKLAELGFTGSAESAKIVAKEWREKKLALTPDEMRTIHRAHGEAFGDEARKVTADALERGPTTERQVGVVAAVDFARERQSERSAVFEHFAVVRDALRHSQRSLRVQAVEAEVERRIETGDLVSVSHVRAHAPKARYATPEMQALERDTLARMRAGMNAVEPILPDADLSQAGAFADNPKRLELLEGFLKTQDQITGMNGAAGSAKSTSVKIVADHAIAQGFAVQGLAPTGTASDSFKEKGIRSQTLQMYLARHSGLEASTEQRQKTLFLLDEASLADAKRVNAFMRTLRPADHLILIGDDASGSQKVGQHTSIDAGRMFQELQEGGMKTAQLNRIYRQKNEEVKQIVLEFRAGHTVQALSLMQQQNRIHVQTIREQRYRAIAEWYAEKPRSSVVVSPDNGSREAINCAIREALRAKGVLQKDGYELPVLRARDVAGMDRTRSDSYRVGDTLRYARANAQLGVAGKSYATVIDTDIETNQLKVKTQDGRVLEYDPSRTGSGVSVYETKIQPFAVGEKVQFTSGDQEMGVSTRSTGILTALDERGNAEVTLDRTRRKIRWNLAANRHLDYSYAMTSHSVQSLTFERSALHIDTGDSRLRGLINQVSAYVGASRPEHEVVLFTDSTEALARVMGRTHEAHKALAPEQIKEITVEASSIGLARDQSFVQHELGMTA